MKSLTNDMTILVMAGPKSRAVLSAVSRGDWSKEAFRWLSVREAYIGFSPVVVMAVSFSGELAYEIHVPNASLLNVWRTLRAAGESHGMTLFGSRAVESMRLEKGYRHWKADLITEFDPFESALDRFVKLEKGDFVGKSALEAKAQTKAFVTFVVDCDAAPAQPGASVMLGDKVVGTITSGDWGHRVGENLAMGFVDREVAGLEAGLAIDVLGRPVPATIVAPCRYDPENTLVRG